MDNKNKLNNNDTSNKNINKITKEIQDIRNEMNNTFNSEFFRNNYNYMDDPINNFYLRINPYIGTPGSDDTNNIEYDQSPFSVIFMTTPDCQNIAHDNEKKTISYLFLKDSELFSIPFGIRSMLVQHSGGINPFINLITNFYTSDNISIPSITLDTKDYGENKFGIKQTLPKNLFQSQVTPTFSITYNDISAYNDLDTTANYGKLLITNLHKAWVKYIHDVQVGILHPGYNYSFIFDKEKGNPNKALLEKIRGSMHEQMAKLKRVLNYVSSLFYFKLAPDGETITYWGRFLGVYPKSWGNDNFGSNNKGGVSEITVEYQAQFYSDLDIQLLIAFNLISFGIGFFYGSTLNDKVIINNLEFRNPCSNIDTLIPVFPDDFQRDIRKLKYPFIFSYNNEFKLFMPTNYALIEKLEAIKNNKNKIK